MGAMASCGLGEEACCLRVAWGAPGSPRDRSSIAHVRAGREAVDSLNSTVDAVLARIDPLQ